MPSPNVDSAVIRLDLKRKHELSADEEKTLFKLIRAGFSQRRKQLVNPLSPILKRSKAEIAELLTSVGLKPTARAEELTLQDYIKLVKQIG